uniref:Uncharacterized protein n=1 Tax=Candidatus Kentrum eta TaxID=2126337 RepID=A0A450VDE4_9GAMM|nr:MAG: hypothetical protein BECKH772A_GA0070896_101047 [Candidatus Kentron sp. H]VFJ97514.1 MAG: hypothetical protein BECKH772B_GA0070898_101137 [Candidatus Kentron sp. H]VFK02823.1 MAG: hypothetical protein BECKH772C_GA0070978_101047 [Candidatus Kentron sp. H]
MGRGNSLEWWENTSELFQNAPECPVDGVMSPGDALEYPENSPRCSESAPKCPGNGGINYEL